jgi:hypothetical protein
LWGKRLKFNNFQGVKLDSTRSKASTYYLINVLPLVQKNGDYKYFVFCYFNKTKSFIENKSQNLLEHEELHFDIAEVFTRKMRLKYKYLKNHSSYLTIYNN